jgi:flagella basal body P-ring formation protein FlgA
MPRPALPAALAILLLSAIAAPAFADDMRAPAPKAVIYPGDTIREDMLTEAPLAAPSANGPVALSADDVVGMMAIRTLLPGLSIPISAVAPPRLFRAGAPVKMLYIEGGLVITAAGAALQDGVVGQPVSVRNNDSGVTVSGRVRSDGLVLVNGG